MGIIRYPVHLPYKWIRLMAVFLFFFCSFSAGCITFSGTAHPPVSPVQSKDDTYSHGPVSIIDENNNTVTIPHPAGRIVTQNGVVAEILVGIGKKDAIVGYGNSLLSEEYLVDKMPDAQNIGGLGTPNYEQIITLKPDVMISYTSYVNTMDKLAKANIPVIYLDSNRIQDIPADTRKLGVLTGKVEESERYARFIEKYLSLVNERLENVSRENRPQVYIESFGKGYSTYGRGSLGDSVLTLLKVKNIAEDVTDIDKTVVTPEWIISRDPDIIIKYVGRADNLTESYHEMRTRSAIANVSAIRNGRIYAVKTDLISGPRGVAGLLYLAKMIYPDRFPDIDPDRVLHEYAESFIPGSDEVETYLPHTNQIGSLA